MIVPGKLSLTHAANGEAGACTCCSLGRGGNGSGPAVAPFVGCAACSGSAVFRAWRRLRSASPPHQPVMQASHYAVSHCVPQDTRCRTYTWHRRVACRVQCRLTRRSRDGDEFLLDIGRFEPVLLDSPLVLDLRFGASVISQHKESDSLVTQPSTIRGGDSLPRSGLGPAIRSAHHAPEAFHSG